MNKTTTRLLILSLLVLLHQKIWSQTNRAVQAIELTQELVEGSPQGVQTVKIKASGGSKFLWNTGATTQSIGVPLHSEDRYTVEIEESDGRRSNISTSLALPVLLKTKRDPSKTNQLAPAPGTGCPDFGLGGYYNRVCSGTTLTLVAQGGTSYRWYNGATTSSITMSPVQGNNGYTVAITYTNPLDKSQTCTEIKSTGPIEVVPQPTASITEGGGNHCGIGIATLSANAGQNVTGASFLWSTGQTTSAISLTTQVTTSVGVRVSTGGGLCSSDASTTIVVTPFSPNVQGASQICLGTGTVLTASGGSTYKWDNNSASNSRLVTPTSVGTHVYTVTISIGSCSRVLSHAVTVTPAPTATILGPDKACYNGSVSLSASGTGSYRWSTGATSSSINPSLLDRTQSYSLTVTNTSTQCASVANKTVTVLPPPSLNEAPNSICAGQSVSLSVTGGLYYSWNVGGTGASIVHWPNNTTEYRVTVTDASGCVYNLSKPVNVSALPSITFGGGTSICAGQSLQVTAFGGQSYRWNNNATTGTITVSPTQNTTYTVTATNSGGCTSTAQRVISVTSPVGKITAPDTISQGQSATLLASASGGSAPWMYNWSTGSTNASISVSPISTTTYSVEVKDANGCVDTEVATINVRPGLIANAGADKFICSGSSTTLGVNVVGGISPYTYAWSNGANTRETLVSPAISTTYTVTVTDSNNKTGTDQVVVVVNAFPTASILSDNSPICSGNSAVFTVTGTAGSVLTYKLNNGADQTLNLTGSSQPIALPNATANQVLTLVRVATTGTSACTSTLNGSSTVIVTALPTASILSNNGPICSGNTATFTVTGTAESVLTYKLNNGADQTLTLTGSNQTIALPNATASQVLTLVRVGTTGTSACTSTLTGSSTVAVNASLTASILSNNGPICSGNSAVFTVIGTAESVLTYKLNNGADQTLNLTGSSQTITLPNATANQVVLNLVRVSSPGNPACTSPLTTSSVLTVSPLPTVSIESNNSPVCRNGNAVFTVKGSAGATLTYRINSGANLTLALNGSAQTITANGVINTTTLSLLSVSSGSNPVCAVPLSLSSTVNIDIASLTVSNDGPLGCSKPNVTLSASSTANGAQYLWKNAFGLTVSTTSTASISSAGVYTVEVQSSSGCKTTASTTVLDDGGLPNISIYPPAPINCYNSSGWLQGTSTTAGVSYEWRNELNRVVATQPYFSTSIPGVYTLKVTTPSGCSKTASVNLIGNYEIDFGVAIDGQSQASTSSHFTRSLTCSKSSFSIRLDAISYYNSSLRIISPQGNTIALASGQTQTLTQAGTYLLQMDGTVQVYDWEYEYYYETSCTRYKAFEIKDDRPLPQVGISGDSLICVGKNTVLTASGGSQYLWSTGATTASITTPNLSTATPYTVTVTSSCGKSAVGKVTVKMAPTPVATITGANSICVGNSVTLTAGGGQNYQWSSTAASATTAAVNVSPTAITTYTVTVTDGEGCTASKSHTVTVVNNPTASIVGNNGPICAGGNAVFTVTGTNGATLFYKINNGAEASLSMTGSNRTMPVNGVSANTTLSLIRVVSSACTIPLTASSTVAVESSPSLTVSNNGPLGCSKPNVTLSASSTATGVQYLWKNAFGLTVSTTSTASVSSAGVYTVEVQSSSGCKTTASTTVVDDGSLPNIVISPPTQLSCYNPSVGISGSSTTAGVSYEWRNELNRVVATQASFTTSIPGVYTLKVTTPGGCSKTASVNVDSDYSIDFGVSIDGQSQASTSSHFSRSLTCSKSSFSIRLDAVSSYNSLQIISPRGNAIELASGQIQTLTEVGTYVLQMTSLVYNGYFYYCARYKAFEIKDDRPLPQVGISGDSLICVGKNTVLTASGGSQYLWSTGATTASITTPNLSTATPYTVTVTSSCGTSAVGKVTVKMAPTPVATITGANSICAGSPLTLTASGGQTYRWSNNAGSATSAAVNVSPTAITTYTVTVTDGEGCSNTASKTVTVSAPLSLSHTLTGTNDCIPNNAAVIPTVSGGTGSITLSLIRSGESAPSPQLNGLSSGTYVLKAVDERGCLALREVVIAEKQPAPAIDLLDAEVCAGTTANLSINNAVAYTTFLWSTGATTSSIATSPGATSTYTVTATASNGCQATDEVVLRVNPALTASAGGGISMACVSFGTPVITNLYANASGGTPPYAFDWGGGQTEPSILVNVFSSSSFGFTVTDSKGCKASAGTSIGVGYIPQSRVLGGDLNCYGDNTTLTATGGQSYRWNTGATSASITVTPTSSTFYSVTVSNGACPAPPAGKMVVVPPALSLAYDVVKDEDCILNNAQVIPIPINAQGALNYVITPQNTTDFSTSLSGWGTGEYTLSAIDGKGCMADTTVVINEAPALQVQANISGDTLDCLRGNVQVSLSSTGARGPVSYHFDSPQSANLAPTSFRSSSLQRWVYAVDTVGCVDSVEVLVRDSIASDLINDYTLAFDRDCIDGNAAITLQLSSAGATLPLSFQLNRETPTAQFHFDSLRAGNYLIRARYQDCRDSVAVLVDERIPRITGFQYLNQDDCKPNNTGVKLQAVSGWGTLRYQVDTLPPQDSSRFDSLAAGSHRFLVIDSLQCRDSLVIPISSEQPAYISVVDLVKCDSASGRISFRPNTQGVAAEYSIDGGKHWQTEVVFDSLPPGIYQPLRRKPSTGCIDSLNTVVLGRHCDTIPEAYFLQDIIRITEPNTSVLIRWEAKAPKWYRDTFYVKMKLEGDGFPHFNDGSRTNAQTPELRGGDPLTGPNVYRYIGGGTHRDSLYLPMQDSAHLYTYPADYYFTLSTPLGGKTLVDPDRDITRVTVSLLGPEVIEEEVKVTLCKDCTTIGKEDLPGASCYHWPNFPNPGQKTQEICTYGQFTRMTLDENLKVIKKTVYTVKLSNLSVKINAQLAVPFACNNPDDSSLEAVATSTSSKEPIAFKWSTGETSQRIKLRFSTSTYKVTVTQGECSVTAEYTLPNTCNAQQIKEFFEGNGFFAIPITDVQRDPTFRTPEQRTACPQPEVSANNVKDYAKSTFKVNNGQVNPLSQLDAALDKFKTVFKYGTVSGLITSNDEVCACPNYLSDKKSEFSTGSGLKFWYHIFKQDPSCPETSCDMLFIKAKMPDGTTYPASGQDVDFLSAGYAFMGQVMDKTGSNLLDVVDDLCLDNFVAAKTVEMFEHREPVKPSEIAHLLNGTCWDGLTQTPVPVITPSAELVMLPESAVWRFQTPENTEYVDGILTGFTKVEFREDQVIRIFKYVQPQSPIAPPCVMPGYFVKTGTIKAKWTELWEARKDATKTYLVGYYKLGAEIDAYPFDLPQNAEQKKKIYRGNLTYLFGDCNQGYKIESADLPEALQKKFVKYPYGLIPGDLSVFSNLKYKVEDLYSICPADMELLAKQINLYSAEGSVYIFKRTLGGSISEGLIYEFFDSEKGGKSWAMLTPGSNLWDPEIWVWNCTLASWQKLSKSTDNNAQYCAAKTQLEKIEEIYWPIFEERTRIHTALGLVSIIPIVGNVASIANGILYVREKQTQQGVLEIVIGTVGLAADVIGARQVFIAGRLGAAGQLVRTTHSYTVLNRQVGEQCIEWKHYLQLDELLGESALLKLNDELADLVDPVVLDNINENLKALVNNADSHGALKWINQLANSDAETAASILKKALGELNFSKDEFVKLVDDFGRNGELLTEIGKNTRLLEAWKVVSSSSAHSANLDVLDIVLKYKSANPEIPIENLIAKFSNANANQKDNIIKIWKHALLDFDPSLAKAQFIHDDLVLLTYDGIIMGTAKLHGGSMLAQLDLDIIIPIELQGKGIFRDLFNKAVDSFQAREILATWKVDPVKYAETGGISTNLAAYREARKTMSAVDAAFQTPTGIVAKDKGFVRATVDTDEETIVVVRFN